MLYRGACRECGYEKVASYGDFKKKIPTCRHGAKKLLLIQPKHCLFCGKEIPFENMKPSEYEVRKFCNNSCSAKYNNPLKKRAADLFCLNCGKLLLKSSKKYCSHECQTEHQRRVYIARWKSGEEDGLIGNNISKHIRNYLLDKYNHECSRCGWKEVNPYSGKIPLEIDHIDGDYRNNSEDNLIVLCPNCHSLTRTFRSLNWGHGRPNRRYPKTITIC